MSGTSGTPEEVEKAEYELLMDTVTRRLIDGKPLTLATMNMTPAQIMAMRDQLMAERAHQQFEDDAKLLDGLQSLAEPKTTCPLCGKPSLENKTCVTCLDTYIAESNKWLEDNVR